MVKSEESILMQRVIDALKPLSPQRRRLAIGLANGFSNKIAGLAAGYKSGGHMTNVSTVRNCPEMKEALNKIDQAQLHGLSKDLLFSKHKQLIDAKKTINTSDGLVEVADNATQAKVLELGYRVLDVLKEESTVTIETHESRMRRLRAGDCD